MSQAKIPEGATIVETDNGPSETLVVNIGPSHPITHGTLRIQLELDGERVLRAACEIGYLHRGFEKQSETVFYPYVVPYAERLNYCSAPHNSNAWCYACEQLLGIEAPPRAQAIRVITSEMSRITDHCVMLGANIVDIGALSNFWFLNNIREKMLLMLEELTGARMMVNYARIGGVAMDVPDGWIEKLLKLVAECRELIADVAGLLLKNRIFLDRTVGVAPISQATALNYGVTGPPLRSTGLSMDLRKDAPYWGYEQYDFEVPVGTNGDTFDRISLRFYEMEQSFRIIEQACRKLPKGPTMVTDHQVALPPKDAVYNQMEALINHFKLVMHGIQPPVGEIYSATEAPNGELGFFIVSDGGPKPWRVRIRPPCFLNYSPFPVMMKDQVVADIAAALGSINIIAGELDR